MFEIIGMVVVAWVVWTVGKAIFAVAAKETLRRAVTYAASRGVPHEVSEAILEQPALVKQVRKGMARASREFAALDGYEQYGKALIGIHATSPESLDRAAAALEKTAEKVNHILRPQLRALEADGTFVIVDYITFVYVGALAIALAKKPVSYSEIKHIVEHCFEGDEHSFGIENAWAILQQSSDFTDKLVAMTPIAQAESAAGEGEFFAKYRRKHGQNGGLHTGPRRDLSKVRDDWFLEV